MSHEYLHAATQAYAERMEAIKHAAKEAEAKREAAYALDRPISSTQGNGANDGKT